MMASRGVEVVRSKFAVLNVRKHVLRPQSRLHPWFDEVSIEKYRLIRPWLQLRFDHNSTALRPVDDLRYNRAAALRPATGLRHRDRNDL